MVDTVKLLIPVHNPLVFDGSRFTPTTLEQLVNSSGYGKTYLNPSPIYTKIGKYMPRLTMYKRASKGRAPVFQLAVEFSAPKMVFGNNFDELQESDLGFLLAALQTSLHELLGHRFFKHQLAKADVSTWHASKNIVFIDYTSCHTILSVMGKLDVSKTYDFQKTDFRDGHVVHIHTNSLDIAFYDKMADLRKTVVSNKRSFEKDGLIQLNLLQDLSKYRPLEVFRYEVRFVGRASVKRAYPDLEQWTLETLFSRKLCRDVLVKHWDKLTNNVDMLALDVKEPYELLQNFIEDNDDVSLLKAFAAVAGLLVTNQVGAIKLRNLIESRFGRDAWYRLRSLLKPPRAHRFKAFVRIDETLQRFTALNMSDYLASVDNNGKLC